MKTKLEKELLDLMWKNPNNWKGILYVNRKDPRLIVPKSNPSFGWTLNLGNIFTYLALMGVLVIAIVSGYFY